MSDVAAALPAIHGTAESICGVLDRLERRIPGPGVDLRAIAEDIERAQKRLVYLRARVAHLRDVRR